MRESIIRYAIALLLTIVTSCIKNDIPYPYIELYITSVEGDGFTTRTIDNTNRVVYLTLEEQTDIQEVNITSVNYTDGAILSKEVVGVHDMNLSLTTTLSLYQDYEWKIIAEQEISHSFTVVGQIGAERINFELGTVDVDVNQNTVDLNNVDITTMKLGPADITTYSPSIEVLEAGSFDNNVRRVTATAHDREYKTWSIRLYAIEPQVSITAYPWGQVAWLRAEGDTSDPTTCFFEYKRSSDTDWIQATPESCNGGVFELCLTGLTTNTEYIFRSSAGGATSSEVTASTESITPLTNGDFENWSESSSAGWAPYLDAESMFWDTGNEGSKKGGETLTTPDSSDKPSSTTGQYSAKMESKFVLAKFAAGSIYTGDFFGLSGLTNGIINFGRPFTSRPLALEGMAKYICSQIKYTNSSVPKTTDDFDEGSIYIALGVWDYNTYGGTETSPLQVNTSDTSTFFNKNGDDVIAYGELYYTESTDDWESFRIDLTYKAGADGTSAYERIPTHMIIVCSSSRYGDYFVGGTDSKLWLDDLTLVY